MSSTQMEQKATDYLKKGRAMQLATVAGDQPWICTVYYVADNALNLYWLSLPTRRHSQELEHNKKAAVTVAVKFDQPVIGVQAEGTVSVINDALIVKRVMPKYIKKYDNGKDFYKKFQSGTNEHVLYMFSPTLVQLIDEASYPGQPPFQLHVA